MAGERSAQVNARQISITMGGLLMRDGFRGVGGSAVGLGATTGGSGKRNQSGIAALTDSRQ